MPNTLFKDTVTPSLLASGLGCQSLSSQQLLFDLQTTQGNAQVNQRYRSEQISKIRQRPSFQDTKTYKNSTSSGGDDASANQPLH